MAQLGNADCHRGMNRRDRHLVVASVVVLVAHHRPCMLHRKLGQMLLMTLGYRDACHSAGSHVNGRRDDPVIKAFQVEAGLMLSFSFAFLGVHDWSLLSGPIGREALACNRTLAFQIPQATCQV